MGLERRYIKLKKRQRNTMTGQEFQKNEVLYIHKHDDTGLVLLDPRNSLRRLYIKLDFDIIELV